MKINYNKILEEARVILRNKVEERYRKDFPSLDIDLVDIQLDENTESMFKALVEIINENK